MNTAGWRCLDDVAHFLYCPTMLGARCRRARWHHRIHLIPRRVLGFICHSLDGREKNEQT